MYCQVYFIYSFMDTIDYVKYIIYKNIFHKLNKKFLFIWYELHIRHMWMDKSK